MRPDVCAHQSPAVIDGAPALLGQGGVFRQAIPGLSENASASCLARVYARLFHLGLRCSAQPDGENVKSHGKGQSQSQNQSDIKSALPPALVPSPLGGDKPVLDTTRRGLIAFS